MKNYTSVFLINMIMIHLKFDIARNRNRILPSQIYLFSSWSLLCPLFIFVKPQH